MSEEALGDKIPDFGKKSTPPQDVSITNLTALSKGVNIQTTREIVAIVALAVVIVVGAEILLRVFQVPAYVMPTPSSIFGALVTEMPFLAEHIYYTLVQLLMGYAIGASIGLFLAAVITQFPFAEKIIAPTCFSSSQRRCWRSCRC